MFDFFDLELVDGWGKKMNEWMDEWLNEVINEIVGSLKDIPSTWDMF